MKTVIVVVLLLFSTMLACAEDTVRMEAEMIGNEPGTNNNPYILYNAIGKVLGKARPTLMDSEYEAGTSMNPYIVESEGGEYDTCD